MRPWSRLLLCRGSQYGVYSQKDLRKSFRLFGICLKKKRRNGKRIERKSGNLVLSRSPPLSSTKLIKLSDNTFTLELTVGKDHPNLFQSVIRISARLRLRLLRNWTGKKWKEIRLTRRSHFFVAKLPEKFTALNIATYPSTATFHGTNPQLQIIVESRAVRCGFFVIFLLLGHGQRRKASDCNSFCSKVVKFCCLRQ